MFRRKDENLNVKLPLEKRFELAASKDQKKRRAANQIQETGVLNTSVLPQPGQPVSSVSENNFDQDQRFNTEVAITQFAALSTEFDHSKKHVKDSIRTLFKDTKALEAEVKEAQLQQSLSSSRKVIVNLFNRDTDLQWITPRNNFLYQDPVTSSVFPLRYGLSLLQDNGFTLPINKSIPIPITNIVRDHGDSEIGHLIVEETNPINLLEGGSYKILFLDRDRDSLGNPYTHKSSYKICLWIELGGLQPINRLDIESSLPLDIQELRYLDHNEDEINLSFQEFPSHGFTSVSFDKVVGKVIKVVFSTKFSTDTTLLQEQFGRIYCLTISNIRVLLDTYNNTGFFLSHPLSINKLNGIKIQSNFASTDNFLLETYLKLEDYNETSKLVKYINIPLLESYNTANTFALYFINKIAKLQFFPSSDFVLYKNGVELSIGTDYSFFTSADSTQLGSFPTADFIKTQQVYVTLTEFDPFAKYTCLYTPLSGVKTSLGYKYSSDTLNIGRSIDRSSKVYLFAIIRHIKQGMLSLPVFENYSLELYNES